MKVLITGGAGYIGSLLIDYLLKKCFTVYVIDSFLYEEVSLLQYTENENFFCIRGDARDKNLIKDYINKVDIIIPLAALVGAPLCDKDIALSYSINTEAIQIIADLKSKDQIILFPMTNSGYGIGGKEQCTENSPLNPISIYGKSKVDAEKIIMECDNFVSFRLATVFGISNRLRLDLLVNNFVWRALKDGFVVLYEANFRRNYIHVRDVCRCFCYAIENIDNMKNNVFNLGLSSANLTKKELCKKIVTHIPNFTFFESEISTDQDKRDYEVSNAKIESFGFRTNYDVDYGIKELKKVYQYVDNKFYSNY